MISLRSMVTSKLLDYFYLNPQEQLHVNDICRKLAVDKRNLVKKLVELEDEGILQHQEKGNLKLYSINPGYRLYDEYRTIIAKTVGVEHRLKGILSALPGIQEAHIFGSYARNQLDSHSDIDFLVVGTHGITMLQKELGVLQREVDRVFNPVSMDPGEFKKRLKGRDPFLTGIFRGKTIRLI